MVTCVDVYVDVGECASLCRGENVYGRSEIYTFTSRPSHCRQMPMIRPHFCYETKGHDLQIANSILLRKCVMVLHEHIVHSVYDSVLMSVLLEKMVHHEFNDCYVCDLQGVCSVFCLCWV